MFILCIYYSAGIGRTGTYIALDAFLEEGRTTGYVNIAKFVMKMRYSRMNMIQTPVSKTLYCRTCHTNILTMPAL
jgi:protein tyrosine phosphatase